MNDGLPEKLYTAWRSLQPDPTTHPSWGNVEAETRRTWDAVAVVARSYVTEKCASMLGVEAAKVRERNDHDFDLADGYSAGADLLRSS